MAIIDYESHIVDIPDYPQPGVIFKDVTPIFADDQAFAAVVDELSNHFKKAGVTKVIGAEARGFMVGAPVAYHLGAGFVPARKPGKLPRAVLAEEYSLEYGTDRLEIHEDALVPGDRVLIVDDLLATGGTALAAARLAKRAGAEIVGFGFIMELAFLNPRKLLRPEFDQEIFTLVTVD